MNSPNSFTADRALLSTAATAAASAAVKAAAAMAAATAGAGAAAADVKQSNAQADAEGDLSAAALLVRDHNVIFEVCLLVVGVLCADMTLRCSQNPGAPYSSDISSDSDGENENDGVGDSDHDIDDGGDSGTVRERNGTGEDNKKDERAAAATANARHASLHNKPKANAPMTEADAAFRQKNVLVLKDRGFKAVDALLEDAVVDSLVGQSAALPRGTRFVIPLSPIAL